MRCLPDEPIVAHASRCVEGNASYRPKSLLTRMPDKLPDLKLEINLHAH